MIGVNLELNALRYAYLESVDAIRLTIHLIDRYTLDMKTAFDQVSMACSVVSQLHSKAVAFSTS